VRPGAAVTYYDMMTQIKNPELSSTPSGYQNYATRYDANGGADLGYRIATNVAVTLGARYGHQGQQQFTFTKDSSPSDYERLLVGLEGRPWPWLSAQLLGGPDFRQYEADSATHITPVGDHNPVKYYGEAVLTATATPQDTFTFKYKQFQFVSCLGSVPYFDSSFDLSYTRKFSKKLSLDVGAKWLSADYTSGNLETCRRDDRDYVLSTALHYAFTSKLGADLGYQADLGRNAEDGIANAGTRNFNRQLISLGLQFKL
jgi:hypothetical protein